MAHTPGQIHSSLCYCSVSCVIFNGPQVSYVLEKPSSPVLKGSLPYFPVCGVRTGAGDSRTRFEECYCLV